MDDATYLRQLVQEALPYVEGWTDTSLHKGGAVPKALGTKDVHAKLVKRMRDEAVKQ